MERKIPNFTPIKMKLGNGHSVPAAVVGFDNGTGNPNGARYLVQRNVSRRHQERNWYPAATVEQWAEDSNA